MKRLISIFLALAVSLLMSGCQSICTLELFNNTGHDIAIVSIDGTDLLPPRVVKNGETAGLGRPGQIEIRMKDVTWHYEAYFLPANLRQLVGFSRHVVRGQIEPDGKIYLLNLGSVPPAAHLPPQPILPVGR